MIELRGVSVDIGRKRAVSDVSLTIEPGHVVGLLGPNGSGKSTLLRAVYRARHPSAGTILLDGDDLFRMRRRDVAQRIAVLAQDLAIEFDMTVGELVMIGRTPHQHGLGRVSESDRAATAVALERVGCAGLVDRSVHTLSGGERQRVLIARALAQGCDHLVLDEPTNHLDIRYQIEVLELVRQLGVGVIAALHDLSLAGLYCDSAHLMSSGRVVAAGRPAEVITQENVRSAYGTDVLVLRHPESDAPYVLPNRALPPSTSTSNTP